jgi:hypothetical protein
VNHAAMLFKIINERIIKYIYLALSRINAVVFVQDAADDSKMLMTGVIFLIVIIKAAIIGKQMNLYALSG